MGFLLTLIGILALLLALAGIGLGVFMATNPNTRDLGPLFALWWIPAAAGASGILMKDLVTFVVGFVCFILAGAVFVSTGILMRGRRKKRDDGWDEKPDTEGSGNKSRNRPAS